MNQNDIAKRRGLTTVQALATTLVALLSVIAFAGFVKPEKRSKAEQQEALSRIKKTVTASIIYASDYDDLLPYAQTTETAKSVLFPYSKQKKDFESPTPGGKFEFNLNVGGVTTSNIGNPAKVPMWVEQLKNNPSDPVTAFSDGHATVLDSKDKRKAVEDGLKKKFQRKPSSRPLPKNYRFKM